MNSLETCRCIALLLRETLGRGLLLSPQLRQYIDSTLGTPSFGELAAVTADEDHCEREPLLDLLLFPDTGLKSRLEDLLPDTEDQLRFPALLLDDFLAEPPESGLVFPETGQLLRFTLSPELSQRFIARLHLDTLLAPRLLEAVAPMAAPMRAKLRVRLRCTRRPFTDRDAALIERFCRRFPAPETVFAAHFDFLAAFLETLGPATDPYAELMARKRLAHQLVKQAQDFERKLRREPIEALMLRGERCPSTGIEDARREMARIDRISLALFGRTEAIPEEIAMDHGEFDPECEMESVMKLFLQE